MEDATDALIRKYEQALVEGRLSKNQTMDFQSFDESLFGFFRRRRVYGAVYFVV